MKCTSVCDVQRARARLQRFLAQPHHLERRAAARASRRARPTRAAACRASAARLPASARATARRSRRPLPCDRRSRGFAGGTHRSTHCAPSASRTRPAGAPRLVRKFDELHEHVVHDVLGAARTADEAARATLTSIARCEISTSSNAPCARGLRRTRRPVGITAEERVCRCRRRSVEHFRHRHRSAPSNSEIAKFNVNANHSQYDYEMTLSVVRICLNNRWIRCWSR